MPTGDTQDVFGQTDAVNTVFRKGVMFISSDEVIRVRKGSGDINGGLSQTRIVLRG